VEPTLFGGTPLSCGKEFKVRMVPFHGFQILVAKVIATNNHPFQLPMKTNCITSLLH